MRTSHWPGEELGCEVWGGVGWCGVRYLRWWWLCVVRFGVCHALCYVQGALSKMYASWSKQLLKVSSTA